jgi:hypothetical protein
MKHLEIRTVNEIDEAHIGQLLHLVWDASGSAHRGCAVWKDVTDVF